MVNVYALSEQSSQQVLISVQIKWERRQLWKRPGAQSDLDTTALAV